MNNKYIVGIVLICLITSSALSMATNSSNDHAKTSFSFDNTDTEIFNPSEDCFINMNDPNSPKNGVSLKIKNRFGISSDWEKDILIKFDLNSIPDNAIINSASLYLYYFDHDDNNPAGRPITVYKVTSNWNEETVTWNTRPSYSGLITSENVPSSYGWMNFDVTSSVQNMVSGSQTNYGWQLMDETYWGGSYIPGTNFRSKESGTDIPYLEVQYTANDPPIADAGGPYNANVDEIITFDGGESYDPDGSIVEYTWNFGDGYAGNGIAPTHSYANSGPYIVTLTVRDNEGETDIDSTSVNINAPPIANASGPYTSKIDEIIVLDASNSIDTDGSIETYQWDLDNDGQYDDANGINPEHKWTEKGEFTIKLKVTDDDQSSDTDSTTVTITNNPPETPSTPEGPDEGKIQEEHSYTTTTNEPDGHKLYYKWSWGDGTESDWLGPYENGELCTASYSWDTEDDYEIKVKAKDNYDEESDWSEPISVTMPHQKNIDYPIFYLIKWILNQFQIYLLE